MSSRRAVLEELRSSAPVIAPSLLKCDFSNLQREIAQLDSAGARVYHWDVMDGHFVPALTYGAPVIKSTRPLTRGIFDAHLMIADPAKYLDEFLAAGCNSISIHLEAVVNPKPLLRRLREADVVAGLAINPKTPLESVRPFLGDVDMLLVMSVEPGFGGQKFLPGSAEKLRAAKAMLPVETVLAVDGGINLSTIGTAGAAGAGFFVVGSAIFDEPDYGTAIQTLAAAAASARKPAGLQEPARAGEN